VHYVTFWKNLRVVAGLEKLASSDEPNISRPAQVLLGNMCDYLFGEVKKAGDATKVTEYMFALRNAHRDTGEKHAAAPEETAGIIQKLAAAVFVDEILSEQLEKLSGDEYYRARDVQLLGREYAVNLMRGLFA
jgi:hypothetical protein